MSKPSNAPESCPGTESERAGKESACAGCPNQSICASGKASGPDPDIAKVKERMAEVKHKILVLSGKGGVGKSTFSAQLATSLAGMGAKKEREERDDDNDEEKDKEEEEEEEEKELPQVGILDVDICGPSIPRILGVEGEEVHMSNSGWTPVYAEENLAVMSIGFMLGSAEEAVIWRGPKKNGLIKQFLRDVNWSNLDYLVVDTPPGTSDEHLSVVQYLRACGLDGAVIVTTPQEVALLDVRKEINFCKKVKLPVLGVVENMSGFVCPKCKTKTDIFAPTSGGAEKMAKEMGVPFLGRVPLDPNLARSCDEGTSFLEAFPSSPAAVALEAIIKKVKASLQPK